MTSGEDQARAGLASSVEQIRQQVTLTEESRLLLQAGLRQDVRDAFAEGLKEAMTSENARLFMRSMLAEAQKMAAEKSVEVAGGLLKAAAMKALTFLFLGGIVYSLGGWGALASFVKWLTAAKGSP